MRIQLWQRNLAAVWLAQLTSAIGFSFIVPFIPLFIRDLGAGGTIEAAQWTGVIAASSAVSMTIAQPIWGNLADRWGRKPMLIRSMIGGGVTVVLMGIVTSPGQLLVLRFVQGALTGVAAAATALVATSTPEHHLGYALGLTQVALFLGNSIGPLIGGVLADSFGYRSTFFAAGILLLVGGAIVIGFVRENFARPALGARRPSIWSDSRSLLAIALFPSLLGVMFLIQVGGMIVAPVLSLFIEELSRGSNVATAAGTVFALTGATSAISAIAIGRLGDRIGHNVVLPICLIGAAICYFPQAIVQQVWQLLLLRMLLGACLGGLMPSANALVASLVPEERRGGAFGLTATANSLAQGVGPLSGAFIASQWGMRSVFLVIGAVFALGWGWVGVALRKYKAPRGQVERTR